MNRLERLIQRAEEGDEEASCWIGFLNLTLISVLVVVLVLLAMIWI